MKLRSTSLGTSLSMHNLALASFQSCLPSHRDSVVLLIGMSKPSSTQGNCWLFAQYVLICWHLVIIPVGVRDCTPAVLEAVNKDMQFYRNIQRCFQVEILLCHIHQTGELGWLFSSTSHGILYQISSISVLHFPHPQTDCSKPWVDTFFPGKAQCNNYN